MFARLQLHFGPIFARPSLINSSVRVRRTESTSSLLGHPANTSKQHDKHWGRSSIDLTANSANLAAGGSASGAAGTAACPVGGAAAGLGAAPAVQQPVSALQPFQPTWVQGSALVPGSSSLGAGLEDYVIHPHDRWGLRSWQEESLAVQGGSRGRQTCFTAVGLPHMIFPCVEAPWTLLTAELGAQTGSWGQLFPSHHACCDCQVT